MARLCESLAAEAGVRVTALGRYSRDEDVRLNGVAYHFRKDEPDRLVPGPVTRPTDLYRMARSLRPDVVHFNGMGFPFQLAEMRAWIGKKPLLVVQHHGGAPGSGLARLAQRLCFRAADGFLFTAEGIARPWRSSGLIRPSQQVCEVAEASSDFGPVPREEAARSTVLPGSPAVLWVGRLHARKDPLTALEGFRRSLERLPAAHLTMVFGEAPLGRDVAARIQADSRLGERVHLVGRVPHEELPAWFSAADLFLTSGPDEGSNYALIEALACGTLPVASDIPAHAALTAHGAFAELFPAGEAAACADALVRASARAAPDLRAAIRGHFEKSLSWEVVARRCLAAYDAILASRQTGREG